jgi:hypothetical protein
MNRSGLNSLVDSFKENINDFLNSGNYNITEELGEEARIIVKGLEKIKLDSIFLDTTQKWHTELDSNQVLHEQQSKYLYQIYKQKVNLKITSFI